MVVATNGAKIKMEIFGLKCILCDGPLAIINVANGTVHIQCTLCKHISRPEVKAQSHKNMIYSKFAKKSVDVAYTRQKSQPPPSKSGTFERFHYASAGLRKCK